MTIKVKDTVRVTTTKEAYGRTGQEGKVEYSSWYPAGFSLLSIRFSDGRVMPFADYEVELVKGDRVSYTVETRFDFATEESTYTVKTSFFRDTPLAEQKKVRREMLAALKEEIALSSEEQSNDVEWSTTSGAFFPYTTVTATTTTRATE